MTTEGKDAVGALDYTPEERRVIICGFNKLIQNKILIVLINFYIIFILYLINIFFFYIYRSLLKSKYLF